MSSKTYHVQLHFCEDKLEGRSVRNHHNNKEWEGQSYGLDLFNRPENNKAERLKNSEENHSPGLHVLHVGHIGVVLLVLETQENSVEELDPIHSGDAHVQKDTKEYSKWDKLEDGAHEDGKPEKYGDNSSTDTLVPHTNGLEGFPWLA